MRTPYFPLLLFAFLLFFFFPAVAENCSEKTWVYTFYVKTGSIIKAGTDAKISATLGDADGNTVWVPDLKRWGLMGHKHDYFERGNLDIFSVRGPCIGRPMCMLNLTSDGSGHHHGWYCDYVEVTFTGPHQECSQTVFYVDRWLVGDNLTVVLDGCDDDDDGEEHKGDGRFANGGGGGRGRSNKKLVVRSIPAGSATA